MLIYTFKRLLRLLLLWLALITLTFGMRLVIPGDPVETLFAQQPANSEVIASVRHELGLDQPLPIQYFNYIANALQGDLGKSLITGRPVLSEISDRYFKTVLLAVSGLAIALIYGIGSGVLAVWIKSRVLEKVLTALNLLLVSLPGFWLGLLLLDWFSIQLGWLPVLSENDLVQLILPALTLGLISGALLFRVIKAELLEALNQDYIKTAQAKGLTRQAIVIRHALKNALTPVVTLVELQFGALLGGAIIIENVFAWPGLGQLAVQAINQRDYPIIQGLVLLTATTYVVVNTGVDLLYHWLNPRVQKLA